MKLYMDKFTTNSFTLKNKVILPNYDYDIINNIKIIKISGYR